MLKIIFPLLLLLAVGIFIVQQYMQKNTINTVVFKSANFSYKPTAPNLDSIFKDDHSWVATLSASRKRTIIATGDIIPARSVNYQESRRNNFKWPFEKTAEMLRSADLTLVNLESPLLKKCPLTNEGMVFCGSEKNIEGLIFAGVDIANLANNHSANYGEEGLIDTVELLRNNNIQGSGTGSLVTKNVKSLEFGFLGYNDLEQSQNEISQVYKDKIISDITEAKKQVKVVVVSFHWGVEYTSLPTRRQQDLAYLAINSGADLVIGNHPHWVQPIEIYKNKIIVYAHGNFIFDQMWSKKTEEGVVGKYTFYDNKVIDVEFLPIKIEDYGQPYFLEGNYKKQILNEMKENNTKLIEAYSIDK